MSGIRPIAAISRLDHDRLNGSLRRSPWRVGRNVTHALAPRWREPNHGYFVTWTTVKLIDTSRNLGLSPSFAPWQRLSSYRAELVRCITSQRCRCIIDCDTTLFMPCGQSADPHWPSPMWAMTMASSHQPSSGQGLFADQPTVLEESLSVYASGARFSAERLHAKDMTLIGVEHPQSAQKPAPYARPAWD